MTDPGSLETATTTTESSAETSFVTKPKPFSKESKYEIHEDCHMTISWD